MSKVEEWIWRFVAPACVIGMLYATWAIYVRWGWFFGTLMLVCQLILGFFMVPFLDALLPPIKPDRKSKNDLSKN